MGFGLDKPATPGYNSNMTMNLQPDRRVDQHWFTDQPLTVKQLRDLLTGLDDNLQIVLDDNIGWYVNINAVIIPGNSDLAEFSAVTLFAGREVDTRQF